MIVVVVVAAVVFNTALTLFIGSKGTKGIPWPRIVKINIVGVGVGLVVVIDIDSVIDIVISNEGTRAAPQHSVCGCPNGYRRCH